MALIEKTLVELELTQRLSDPTWFRGGGSLPLVFTIAGGPTFFGINFDVFFDPSTAKININALPDLSGLYEPKGAVATHAAIPDAHHEVFTKANADLLYEALGAVVAHAGVPGAHHTPFTQADADLLYEALGTVATHAGIAAAHHTRYTDAEAIAAVTALVDWIDLTDGGQTNLHSHAGGAATFLALTDTPADYIGQGGKAVLVKGDESGLEFGAAAGGGSAEANLLAWLGMGML